jgi:hypothetical protein
LPSETALFESYPLNADLADSKVQIEVQIEDVRVFVRIY